MCRQAVLIWFTLSTATHFIEVVGLCQFLTGGRGVISRTVTSWPWSLVRVSKRRANMPPPAKNSAMTWLTPAVNGPGGNWLYQGSWDTESLESISHAFVLQLGYCLRFTPHHTCPETVDVGPSTGSTASSVCFLESGCASCTLVLLLDL